MTFVFDSPPLRYIALAKVINLTPEAIFEFADFAGQITTQHSRRATRIMGNIHSGSALTRTTVALDSFIGELGGDIIFEKR